jgi:polyhydroxyalkanoate synthesis regulator phasin
VARRRSPAGDAAEAVRTAVDRTVQATVGQAQLTRDRAQDVVDELAQAAGRMREALDLRALNERLAELERRVEKLERARRQERGRRGGRS